MLARLSPILATMLSPMLASVLLPMLAPRLSSLLASMLSSLLGPMLSSMLAPRLSPMLASMLSWMLWSMLWSMLSSMLASLLASILSWMLWWILGPMRRRRQNIGSRRRGPRPPRAERVAHTPDPDRPACTQMHGGQKWFRCANADRHIDQGCRKTLRTHPVLGCWCFRTVPASPTTRRGVATIWIETAANGPSPGLQKYHSDCFSDLHRRCQGTLHRPS